MDKRYQVTSNGYYFGLTLNGVEVLPCMNSKLWRITTDLVGFRQNQLFGIYSLPENRVVYEPVFNAEIPLFKKINPNINSIVTRARFVSEYGTFIKSKAYLETYDYLFWKNGKLIVQGPSGIFVIHRDSTIREYSGNKPEIAAFQINQRCLYEGYSNVNVSSLKKFDYMSRFDEKIDEQNFLEDMKRILIHLDSESYEKGSGEETDEPAYKHFDYDAIPILIKNIFKKHIDFHSKGEGCSLSLKILIYLAWCHANDFVEYDEWGNCILDPHYALQQDEVIDDVAGIYDMFELDKLQHLLYQSSLTNSFFEVLAFEN